MRSNKNYCKEACLNCQEVQGFLRGETEKDWEEGWIPCACKDDILQEAIEMQIPHWCPFQLEHKIHAQKA